MELTRQGLLFHGGALFFLSFEGSFMFRFHPLLAPWGCNLSPLH
jgi:hypothetical protein